MKQLRLVIAITLYALSLQAQSNLQRPTFSSGGIDKNTLIATIGEPVAIYLATAAGALSVGAQPGEQFISATEEDPLLTGITCFPNPTPGLLNVLVETTDYSDLEARVFNSLGQLIMQQTLTAALNFLDLQQQPAGAYVLRIQAAEKSLTFPIVKH